MELKAGKPRAVLKVSFVPNADIRASTELVPPALARLCPEEGAAREASGPIVIPTCAQAPAYSR